MPSFFASLNESLDNLEEQVREQHESEPFYSRVERNFGDNQKDNVFVQTDDYNLSLYEDGVVGYGDFGESNPEEDKLLQLVEEFYKEPPEGYFWRE